PSRSCTHSEGCGSFTFTTRSAVAKISLAVSTIRAPAPRYCASVAPMPCPAPVSMRTSCPLATYSRTEAGLSPTRYSWSLISFGHPTRMTPSPVSHYSYPGGGHFHKSSARVPLQPGRARHRLMLQHVAPAAVALKLFLREGAKGNDIPAPGARVVHR